MNERLRSTMLRRGFTPTKLARTCDVNAKTVERWINSDRIPHRETRWHVAQTLDVDEVYLWPELLAEPTPDQRIESVESELVRVYPDRASVPRDVWLRLLAGATRHIDILVFAGTFLSNDTYRCSLVTVAGHSSRLHHDIEAAQ
jgi:transcriptional regulator with XRE-family HTH domain